MLRYIVNRLLIVVPLLLALTVLLFLYVHAVPGDPIAGMLGPNGTPELVAQIRADRGLDRPLLEQYWSWLSGLVTGDLGVSLISGQDITPIVIARIPATLQLTFAGLFFVILIGFPAGYLAGKHKGGWLDRILSPAALIGLSMPAFWVGTLLILVLGVQLRWFPTGGYVAFEDNAWQSLRLTLMPALVLGITLSPFLARMVRASTAELAHEPFIVQARTRGLLPGTISRRYLLRNAILPVVIVIGMQLGTLIGGQVIVEQLFNWPGVARLLIEGAVRRDYLLVQSLIFVIAVIYIVINLLTEVVHASLDPRVRL
ncbi:MAG: binding-protein-dependent transport system inner rane component [Naasia sp.]|uniref:ABC transporter permease n=1 Tax=Naasia sp. TaxID=2546198 RepID=UPI0026115C01|nr:ABC transporter permease [Naasia sp.]MCU1571909.1 binding-protein-dependent transport system inner rane component [Naasia sp.]